MTSKETKPPPPDYPHPSGLRPVSPLPPPGREPLTGAELRRLRWIESTLRWFARHDLADSLVFTDADDRLRLTMLVGEAFGGADAETLTPENFPAFVLAWDDLHRATGDRELADAWCSKLFAARIRGTPQRWNRMPEEPRVVGLFEAAKRKDGAE